MKKDYLKVKIQNEVNRFTEVKVTKKTPEVYKIVFFYDDGLVEETIYRSFRNKEAVRRYCGNLYATIKDCVGFKYELIGKL